jgi:hypothetical protein
VGHGNKSPEDFTSSFIDLKLRNVSPSSSPPREKKKSLFFKTSKPHQNHFHSHVYQLLTLPTPDPILCRNSCYGTGAENFTLTFYSSPQATGSGET